MSEPQLLGDLDTARALRIVEIMNDIRTLQLQISQLVAESSSAPALDAPAASTTVAQVQESPSRQLITRRMRSWVLEAQEILDLQLSGFNAKPNPVENKLNCPSDEENESDNSAHLRSLILDASARRFLSHRVYLRIASIRQWEIQVEQLIQNQSDMRYFDRVDVQLEQDLASFTDAYSHNDLQHADERAGYWLDEDPGLDGILNWIMQVYPMKEYCSGHFGCEKGGVF